MFRIQHQYLWGGELDIAHSLLFTQTQEGLPTLASCLPCATPWPLWFPSFLALFMSRVHPLPSYTSSLSHMDHPFPHRSSGHTFPAQSLRHQSALSLRRQHSRLHPPLQVSGSLLPEKASLYQDWGPPPPPWSSPLPSLSPAAVAPCV